MPHISSSFSSPLTEKKPLHIRGFDSLRFLAASSLVFCHIELVKHYRGVDYLLSSTAIYETGKLAVAGFFALSGFLITLLLLKEKEGRGTINIFSFYMRRGLRIWPLYWLIILLLFFVLPKFQTFYLPILSDDMQAHFWVKFILSALLLPQMLLLKFRSIPGGEQLWTIGSEEVFYFLWPLLLLNSKNKLLLAVSIFVVFSIAKYVFYYFSGCVVWPSHPRLIYKAFLTLYYNRIDCILAGAIAAILIHQKNKVWLTFVSKFNYLIAIFFTVVVLYAVGLTYMPVDYIFYSICFAWLISFAIVEQSSLAIASISFTEKMGKISYGIYLWHFIVIFIAFALVNYFFAEEDRNSNAANVLLYFTSYLLTYITAFLSYRFFETPFLSLKNKFSV